MQQQKVVIKGSSPASNSVATTIGGLPPKTPCLLMQNNMVSIPSANLNGGLKMEMVTIPTGNLNGGLKMTNNPVAVGGTVLANAPRVYLAAPSSGFITPNRNANTVATAAVKVIASSSVATSSTSTPAAVRYFSQFSKLQPITQPVQTINSSAVGNTLQLTGQRKLVNGETVVLMNGNKPFILTSPAASGATATVPNGTKVNMAAATAAVTSGGALLRPFIKTETGTLSPNPFTIKQSSSLPAVSTTTTTQSIAPVNTINNQQQQLEPVMNNNTDIKEEPVSTDYTQKTEAKPFDENDPELDIVINNVVCSFSVRCHLKLRDIALNGLNVEYRRENAMVTMKLRRPYTTASIWSSGRITCTGATSEAQAKIAARRYARYLSKLGFPVRFQNFRIVNVLGTCSMPWAIKIVNFSERHRKNASYEPELHPGVTYKMRDPKATLKIFSTGSITVTAANVNDVESAIQHIYPLVHEFRKQRSPEELQHLRQKQRQNAGPGNPSEHEESIVSQSKAAADQDLFLNTTTAHSTNNQTPASSALTTSSIQTVRRLEQFQQYRQLQQQTQLERRHIPFSGDGLKPNGDGSVDAPSQATSTGTQSANARRRATECWATKLQNKRPRYNDFNSAVTSNARSLSSAASTVSSFSAIKSYTKSSSSSNNALNKGSTNLGMRTNAANSYDADLVDMIMEDDDGDMQY